MYRLFGDHTYSREIIDIFLKLKNFNVGFFSDIIKARYFKLCIIMSFPEVYIFILYLMILALFQDYRCVKNINCKLPVLDSSPLQFQH